MKKMVLISLLLSLSPAVVQAQTKTTPLVFSVSDVVVGSQKSETLLVNAAGKWSNASATLGTDSTEIHCFKRFGFCEVASSTAGSNVSLFSFDILRWDSQVLVATEDSSVCLVNTLRVDFAAKTIALSSARKADALNGPACKAISDVPTAFLGGRASK